MLRACARDINISMDKQLSSRQVLKHGSIDIFNGMSLIGLVWLIHPFSSTFVLYRTSTFVLSIQYITLRY